MLTANLSMARSPGSPLVAEVGHEIDRAAIDARVIALFDNASLRSHVRKLDKVELSSVWRLTRQVLSRHGNQRCGASEPDGGSPADA